MHRITVPSPGESIAEVTLGKWHKQDGEWVEKGDLLVEIESDKATLELRADEAGRLSVKARTGAELKVGAEVGSIDAAAPKPEGKPAASANSSGASAPAAASSGAARSLEPKPSPSAAPAPAGDGQHRATSVAKKMAADKGVDLGGVTGTGPSGRITKDDVIAASSQTGAQTGGQSPAAPAPASAASATPAVNTSGGRGVRRERMTKLRQRIAQRLVEAQHTAAMLTTFNEVDMTEVMRLRDAHKEAFEKLHGVGLGFMSFFVAACVSGLRRYPRVNGSIVGDEIEFHDFCDISVAVSTDKGLVVPVVRNAEGLSFAGVEKTIKELALRARDGKLSIDEMTGGTFTITNGGIYGSLMSTPILNPPQSAILGMHTIKKRAVEDPSNPGQVALRAMMYLALSYDHRIIDGAEAVGFLVHVKNAIEKPERLLLGL